MKEHREAKIKTWLAILKFVLLIGIVVVIPLYIIIYHQDVLKEFRSYDDVVAYLRGFRGISGLVYIGAQIVQIVISVLPGGVFQFAAGSIFGFLGGLLLSLLGAALGTTVCFYLAKILGHDAVTIFLGKEKTEKYVKQLNSERAYVIAFILYLIPGVPKDLLCYVAGISEIRLRNFLLISLTARTPGMCASLLFGHMYIQGNYTGLIISMVIASILTLLGIIFRKKLHAWVDTIYERIN